tara:strand:+ start:1127 stop:1588 length:462 start_codon:yes stop_codon:yes gene_type:complete
LKKFKFFLCFLIFSSPGLFSDPEKAKKEFVYDLSLATQGIMVSQYNTGVNYSLGLGIHIDMEKSVYWFQEATKQGHSKAPFNLAILYARGGKVPKDLTLSETYFLLAAERGNKEAKNFIQKVYASETKKTHEAIEMLCCPKLLLHASAIPFKD